MAGERRQAASSKEATMTTKIIVVAVVVAAASVSGTPTAAAAVAAADASVVGAVPRFARSAPVGGAAILAVQASAPASTAAESRISEEEGRCWRPSHDVVGGGDCPPAASSSVERRRRALTATAMSVVRGGALSALDEEDYGDYDEEDEEESEGYDDEEESEADEGDEDESDDGSTDYVEGAAVVDGMDTEGWEPLVDEVLLFSKRVLILAGRVVGKMIEAALGQLEEVEKAKGGRARKSGEDAGLNSKSAARRKKSKSKDRTKSGEAAAAGVSVENTAAYLSETYGVPLPQTEEGVGTQVLGGSLTDALAVARSRARLLVTFVPATNPSKAMRLGGGYDRAAFKSLLSQEVRKVAEKGSKKKKSNDNSRDGENYGSFDLWCGLQGSREATMAAKTMKAKKVAKGSPLLAVCYGAQAIDSSTGRPRLVPRLLAQHHCNPPPSPSSAAAWLSALRKRHGREYMSMRRELQELRYYKERTEGYASSKREDREREERERREEQEKARKEEEERARLAKLEERRVELREGLPLEPPAGMTEGVITVAIRFADGRTGRRRFAADETEVDVLFDWVDCMFGMEREKLELSTMNGSKRFRYEGDGSQTLKEAGLGKMVGLRVTELKEEEEESTQGKGQDGESHGDDEGYDDEDSSTEEEEDC